MKTQAQIIEILEKLWIRNYTLVPDSVHGFVVDVAGSVKIFHKMPSIPVQFRNVTGDFDCRECNLQNLEGCPTSVGGDFFCSHNQLKNVEGLPTSVGSDYIDIGGNYKLKNIQGIISFNEIKALQEKEKLEALPAAPKKATFKL